MAKEVPSPSKNSPPITPPKPKKSRVEEFFDENKDANSVTEVVWKASGIIRDLEKDCALSNARAYALKLKLGGRGTIESNEQDLFPDWLTRNETLSRGQKWLIAIQLKLTPLAAAMNKMLRKLTLSIILFCEIVEQLYDKWRKDYHKTRLPAPANDDAWDELYILLDMETDKEKMAIKVIISEFPEEGTKSDDQYVNTDEQDAENTAEKESVNRYGFLVLGNINNNATKQEIQNYFKGEQITVDVVEHVYDFQRKTKKTGMIAISVDDLDGAVVAVRKIKIPIKFSKYNDVRIIEKHSIDET